MLVSSCLASTVSALNTPSASSAPSATTPCPSRNRSGKMPLKATGSLAPPSATSKVTARLSPRWSEPGCTRPPRRNRLPGATCFSATMVGVEKNTMESRNALSTSAAARASTASEPPMMVIRRCLRVMAYPFPARLVLTSSSVEPERLEAFIELAQPRCIVGDRLAGIGRRPHSLVAITHHEIGAHQAQPTLDVIAVLPEARGEPFDHAANHRVAIALFHVLGSCEGLIRQRRHRRATATDPRERGLHQRPPRRIRRRFRQQRAPDIGGIVLASVLLGGETEKIVRLGVVGAERARALELGLGLGGHDAAGGGRDRFAEIGPALCALAIVGERVAIGAHRVVEAAKPFQHGRDHVPAAPVGRILFQMLLDLHDQILERLRHARPGSALPLRQRKVLESGRAE